MRYVARRYGFNGTTEIEEARADEATELIYDLRLCKSFLHYVMSRGILVYYKDWRIFFLGCVAYKDSFVSATPDIIRHTGKKRANWNPMFSEC